MVLFDGKKMVLSLIVFGSCQIKQSKIDTFLIADFREHTAKSTIYCTLS